MHGFWAGTNAMRYDKFYCTYMLQLLLYYYYLTRTTVGACRLSRHTKGRTI